MKRCNEYMNAYLRMDCGRDRIIMNEEGDRLSSLPDDLIHEILSFMSIKEAIKTSGWSPRWRYIWTSLPHLNFFSEEFNTLAEFRKFVTHVLSERNNQTQVSSLTLSFHRKVSVVFVKEILDYGYSHNIQQLNVKYSSGWRHMRFPLCFFRSQSLKHLAFTGDPCCNFLMMLTSSWDLPGLTTLHLDSVTFDDDTLLSKCVNLTNLTLKRCGMTRLNFLRIRHPRLCNLTLEGHMTKSVDLFAPQLENLSIRDSSGKHRISAANLTSLHLKCCYPFQIISLDGFPFLEKANLCISYPKEADANNIVCLLQQVRSVKFLTLNLEFVECLSKSAELISLQASPFANLKSLTIYPLNLYMRGEENMSTVVKKYLLDGAPSATFTMVSREEIISVQNAILAPDIMEEAKTNIESNMEQEKAEIEKESAQPKTKKKGL